MLILGAGVGFGAAQIGHGIEVFFLAKAQFLYPASEEIEEDEAE